MLNLTPTVRNLLLVNLACFLLQENLRLDPSITQLGSLYPIGSPFFHFWQFFTYMFLHGNWGHIFSNMFGLIVFGPLLEQRWGGQRFLAFWLMCGVGAGMLYEGYQTYNFSKTEQAYTDYRANPDAYEYSYYLDRLGFKSPNDQAAAEALARNPHDQQLRAAMQERVANLHAELQVHPTGGMLGASGALFGVMFAFAYLFPNTELFILFIPFPIKAKYLVFFYALYELYGGIQKAPGDNVAHFAHLGGLLIGFIILRFWEGGRTRFY